MQLKVITLATVTNLLFLAIAYPVRAVPLNRFCEHFGYGSDSTLYAIETKNFKVGYCGWMKANYVGIDKRTNKSIAIPATPGDYYARADNGPTTYTLDFKNHWLRVYQNGRRVLAEKAYYVHENGYFSEGGGH